MTHYDTCRPGNCGICGQTEGYCRHPKVNKEPICENCVACKAALNMPGLPWTECEVCGAFVCAKCSVQSSCPECFDNSRTTTSQQRPGKSKQDYGTPWEFIRAVRRKFGHIAIDLAAHSGNAKADYYIAPETNSLIHNWNDLEIPEGEYAWLNPEFANISPWAEKCACSSIPIIMLVPASVGSNWFARWVEHYAYIFALRPRLTFEGCKDPYPKDCMLCVYRPHGRWPTFQSWDWRAELAA